MFDPFNVKRNALLVHYAVNGSPKQYRMLTERFPDGDELFELAQKGSRELYDGLTDAISERLKLASAEGFMERLFDRLDELEADVVVKEDAFYPELLKEIDLAPNLLFTRGKLPENPLLPIAMVGSRKSTKYGRDIAEMFSYALREKGALLVSGMASGIDSCAARGALRSEREGTATVAVLGTGVDVIYPAENRGLYEEIIERGAVVSELWPGTHGSKDSFPTRNRIISGMSKGLIVVEAAEHSGTTITAGFAHDQGREVFAVPGRITDVMSVGTNRMIQRGEAKPVFCIEDVLIEFPEMADMEAGAKKKPKKVCLRELSDIQRKVCLALAEGETDADTLSEKTQLPIASLNANLTALTFSGIVIAHPGRIFALDAGKIDLSAAE